MRALRKASSVLSRPVKPLKVSYLLDFESRVLSKSGTLSTDVLNYMCEEGTVRTPSVVTNPRNIRTRKKTGSYA